MQVRHSLYDVTHEHSVSGIQQQCFCVVRQREVAGCELTAPGGVSRKTPHVVPTSLPGVPGLVSSRQAIGMPLAVLFLNSHARHRAVPPHAAQHSSGDGR